MFENEKMVMYWLFVCKNKENERDEEKNIIIKEFNLCLLNFKIFWYIQKNYKLNKIQWYCLS